MLLSNVFRFPWSQFVVIVTANMLRATVLLVFTALGHCDDGEQRDEPELDHEFVHKSVELVAATVDREYFNAAIAAQVASTLRKRLVDGDYAEVKTLKSLAEKVTQDLFDLTKDKHLAVQVVEQRSLSSTSTDPDKNRGMNARRTNFGVQRVEILAGNVGYLNLTSFYRPNEAGDVISAAMRMLRSADALIIDMRENGGGSPDTVALVISYLFEAVELPLFEIVPRSSQGGRQYKTLETGPTDRNGTRPTYVLTSKQTFSAGEGFAFLLQERCRAHVIGEQTAGAANPGRFYPVNPYLEVNVPNGQIRTEVTGCNWEGKGVVPDVLVPASDALRTAHIRALRDLFDKNPDGAWQEHLKHQIEMLELLGKQ